MYLNDKGSSTMTCGLFVGVGDSHGDSKLQATEIPAHSTSISVQLVDLVGEITLTYKFINNGENPIRPTYVHYLITTQSFYHQLYIQI